jgi:hypothetical protein
VVFSFFLGEVKLPRDFAKSYSCVCIYLIFENQLINNKTNCDILANFNVTDLKFCQKLETKNVIRIRWILLPCDVRSMKYNF